MAPKYSSKRPPKGGPGRARPTSARRARAPKPEEGELSPAALEKDLRAELRQFQQAHAVLGCLIVALEYDEKGDEGVDYSDTVRAAYRMLGSSIKRLDAVGSRLARSRGRGEMSLVQDHPRASFAGRTGETHGNLPIPLSTPGM